MPRVLGRALAAEVVGTFALVSAGCGAITVDAKTVAVGHVGVAISFGLVIMVVVIHVVWHQLLRDEPVAAPVPEPAQPAGELE
jgi:hypothetical protein